MYRVKFERGEAYTSRLDDAQTIAERSGGTIEQLKGFRAFIHLLSKADAFFFGLWFSGFTTTIVNAVVKHSSPGLNIAVDVQAAMSMAWLAGYVVWNEVQRRKWRRSNAT